MDNAELLDEKSEDAMYTVSHLMQVSHNMTLRHQRRKPYALSPISCGVSRITSFANYLCAIIELALKCCVRHRVASRKAMRKRAHT